MTTSEERARNRAELLDFYEKNSDKPRTYWFLLPRGEQKDWIRKYEASLRASLRVKSEPIDFGPIITVDPPPLNISDCAPTKTNLSDSGEREVKANGFTREPEGSRPDYLPLLLARGIEDVPRELIERIAEHYYQGGLKYSPDNWRKGTDPESLERNRRSAARHFVAWLKGETDEDHLAAVAWNMITYEINKAAEEPPADCCPRCGGAVAQPWGGDVRCLKSKSDCGWRTVS